MDKPALADALDDLAVGTLTDVERADVLFMREEEKLARDTYLTLFDDWGLQPHENIADSEQSHMDAMLLLIEKYGLEDPATDEVGTFTNDELQTLYDDLVATGRESEVDSLEVGCLVEETDILDIQAAIDRTDEPASALVYENLLKGSRNHLRAYVRALERRGVTYDPLFLDWETFDAIVESDWETGQA